MSDGGSWLTVSTLTLLSPAPASFRACGMEYLPRYLCTAYSVDYSVRHKWCLAVSNLTRHRYSVMCSSTRRSRPLLRLQNTLQLGMVSLSVVPASPSCDFAVFLRLQDMYQTLEYTKLKLS